MLKFSLKVSILFFLTIFFQMLVHCIRQQTLQKFHRNVTYPKKVRKSCACVNPPRQSTLMTTDFRATTLAEYSVYRVTPAGCVPCVVPPYQLQIFGKRRFAAQVSVAGKAPMGYSSRRKFTALLLLSGRYIYLSPQQELGWEFETSRRREQRKETLVYIIIYNHAQIKS